MPPLHDLLRIKGTALNRLLKNLRESRRDELRIAQDASPGLHVSELNSPARDD